MIVKKDFYLHSTKKSYKKGTEFKGDKKGREHLLWTKKEADEHQAKVAKENAKIEAADAKRAKLNGQFGVAKHKAEKPKKKK